MIAFSFFLDGLLRLYLPYHTFFFEPQLLLLALFFYYKRNSLKKSRRMSVLVGICYDLVYGKFLFLYPFLFFIFCDCVFALRRKLSSFSCFLICLGIEQILLYSFLQILGYENSLFLLLKNLIACCCFNGIFYFLMKGIHNLISAT